MNFFNNVYIAIERSRGNSRRILKLNLCVVFVKFIITAGFIYGLKADITMIAVATVIITLIMKLHTERGEDELLMTLFF